MTTETGFWESLAYGQRQSGWVKRFTALVTYGSILLLSKEYCLFRQDVEPFFQLVVISNVLLFLFPFYIIFRY
jgi:hypothetical protein